MKKVFMLLIAAASMSLVACGGGDKKEDKKDASAEATSNGGSDASGTDMCDCLMNAQTEEEAMACDKSKSLEELAAMARECMENSMPDMSEGSDDGDGMEGEDGDGMDVNYCLRIRRPVYGTTLKWSVTTTNSY